MMRSLWTAASGMIAQQTSVDTISNNLANVNTTGYKAQTAEFKTLLYQDLQTKTTTANGENKPIPAEVGLGVRNASITTHFSQGSFLESSSDTAFAINGDGFFAVQGTDGETYYTRNGDFTYAIGTQGMMLTTSEGLPVLDTTGQPIVFDTTQYDMSKVQVTSDGKFGYLDENNNYVDLGIQIGLFQFNNPSGLEKLSGSLYSETAASGQAINESVSDTVKKSTIKNGYLEGSNVQVADEMVNLIVAQRAYEMNSKAIQAADEMLSQANQLRR
jgi:flagellar basal-body rod protein FlgG